MEVGAAKEPRCIRGATLYAVVTDCGEDIGYHHTELAYENSGRSDRRWR